MIIQKNTSKFLSLVICSVFLFGCAPKGQLVSREEAQEEQVQDENSEKLNLLDLPADRKIVPLENPKYGKISGTAVIVDVETEQQDSVYQLIEDIPDEIDSLNSQAYRVQIFSSKKFGESRHAKLVAEEIFDRSVFLDYEVPYYKIRVGNFSNREKAEEYQQRVKSSGFKNAWVVVVIVNIKETAPLYDEVFLPEIIDSLYLKDEAVNDDEPNENE